MVFNLDNTVERPLLYLNEIFDGCTGLLDTGALIPMWTKSLDLFLKVFPLATLVRKDSIFSGFGGSAYGDLYRIDFQLGEMIFPNMPIVVYPDENIPGFLLLSATMFSKTDYAIKNSSNTLSIELLDNQRCFNLVIGDEVLAQ